jgi:hypothetical protein
MLTDAGTPGATPCMTARRRCTLVFAGLAACTPRTQPIGEIETDGAESEDGDDDSAGVFSGTTEDDGAADSPETVTVGPDPDCPAEPPPTTLPRLFDFGSIDGAELQTGTATCTVLGGPIYDLDCTGDFVGGHYFEYSAATAPELLFGIGVQTEVTYHAGGDSEWIRFERDGYTMVLVQADRLAPTGISVDGWLPGLYAGTIDEAFCEAIHFCDDGSYVEHLGVWVSDSPDGTGPSTEIVFPGESEQIGGDTYFEMSVQTARTGDCSAEGEPEDALWFVYRFEGPFPV